ncbi:hypothetical protein ILYODFUR_006687 [Ilyodon furcidens]|uniref:Uncharacterized protein n=1 Tax=Ilyodon furcidens TaxID=33524 RepID=A0ABV0SJE4_9TELE
MLQGNEDKLCKLKNMIAQDLLINTKTKQINHKAATDKTQQLDQNHRDRTPMCGTGKTQNGSNLTQRQTNTQKHQSLKEINKKQTRGNKPKQIQSNKIKKKQNTETETRTRREISKEIFTQKHKRDTK